MRYVLFLTEWYPNRTDAMAGLFVQKHAQAVVRQGCKVVVLYFHPMASGKGGLQDAGSRSAEVGKSGFLQQVVSEDFSYEIHEQDGLTEIIFYYPAGLWNYLRTVRFALKSLKNEYGLPSCCQVNVLSKNAWIAYFWWKKYGVPYFILEHWSGYLPQNGDFARYSALKKRCYRFLARQAKCVATVSQSLEEAMKRQGFKAQRWERIDNVVDDFFFADYTPCVGEKKRILNVNCFNEKAKNIKGLLRGIKEVSEKRNDFELVIVGTGEDFAEVKSYSQRLGLSDEIVHFVGEQTPQQVCEWVQKSYFFILFSNYETAGVVLCECLAVGSPILATRVGIAPEIINKESGILMEVGDEKALVQNIHHLLDHCDRYDRAKIRKYGKPFSFDSVGKRLVEVYEQITLPSSF
ncbi:MAG: glycosyltransferase [Paludibacteraceae bacterium]|nr:glycosyltransferase [Paludibacteraceae bacterium]